VRGGIKKNLTRTRDSDELKTSICRLVEVEGYREKGEKSRKGDTGLDGGLPGRVTRGGLTGSADRNFFKKEKMLFLRSVVRLINKAAWH